MINREKVAAYSLLGVSAAAGFVTSAWYQEAHMTDAIDLKSIEAIAQDGDNDRSYTDIVQSESEKVVWKSLGLGALAGGTILLVGAYPLGLMRQDEQADGLKSLFTTYVVEP